MNYSLNYGNWIRKKKLFWLGLGALAMAILAFIPSSVIFRWIAILLSIGLFASFFFPFYAYLAFSPHGGNLQDKFYTLILQLLPPSPSRNALDIGSGNGILTIRLAQSYPTASIVGLDFWGKDWEYSRNICEENAATAKVSDRTHFVQGDAAALDFETATFDVVVSNLTFHEVKSVPRKEAVVKEALRVLKTGGSFAFIDLFYDRQYYGPAGELETYLREMDLAEVKLKPIQEALAIPILLRNPRILGNAGILYGRK